MSRFIYAVTIVVLPFAIFGQAHAQSNALPGLNSTTFKMPESTSSSPTFIKSHNEFELQQSQYTSYGLPEFRDGAEQRNSSLILRLDEQLDKGAFTAKLNGKDEWSASENWNYGDVYELYVGLHRANAQLALGRKLETWSTWDEEWQQGVFQPRYMENRMRMEPAGLTGIFASAQGENLSATFAALPIFIPDFGAHFSVQDDRFVSKNPWFHPPADRFILGRGMGDIHYRLDHPETEQVIKHAGAAAKLEYKNQGYLARVSGAYKPMPQFLLAFPSSHRFQTGPSGDYMNIVVTPRVAYDRVVNLDQIYEHGLWSFSGSVAYSNPEDRGEPADWTQQQVRSAMIYSGGIERRFTEGANSPSLRLGFLKVYGGDAEDSGPLASKETLFERRFQFYEAYLLGFHKDFRLFFHNPLESSVRVIYDRMQGGGMISFNTGMRLSARLHAEVEADFIGLLTSTANITDGFLSEYRANDRVSLGLGYVF